MKLFRSLLKSVIPFGRNVNVEADNNPNATGFEKITHYNPVYFTTIYKDKRGNS